MEISHFFCIKIIDGEFLFYNFSEKISQAATFDYENYGLCVDSFPT